MILFVIDRSRIVTERLLLMANETKNITEVYTAANYVESIRLLEQVQPDIVLMDMHLPDSKSIALIKQIKKQNSHSALIAIFSQVNDIKKQYCEYLGVNFIFDKYSDAEKIAPALNFLTSNN